jgi:basic amino acid/polyamine antiporter, APA family
MPAPTQTKLVRAIGRWSLMALMINVTIGSGIFGLPSIISGLLGPAGVWAYFAAGGIIGIVILCFAEVGSQFRESGGSYLYARAAFGRFAGILTAWMGLLTRIAASAANAGLFVIYLAEFRAGAKQPIPRLMILCALIGFLALINVLGVRAGANVSNFFAVAKLAPLGLFIVLGIAFLVRSHAAFPVALPAANGPGSKVWMDAIVLLVFAFGGFESIVQAGGEMKDPRRDVPFALLGGLAVVAILYALIQVVVVGTLPAGVATDRPLAAAAGVFMGPAGAAIMSVGALISVYGYLSAQVVVVPRLTYGLAEHHDFPTAFGLVHPRFHTPHISILIFAVLILVLAVYGSFQWNAVLSVAARLLCYVLGCAALPVLRRRDPKAEAFRIPAGHLFTVLAIAACLLLATRLDRTAVVILSITAGISAMNWLWARQRRPAPGHAH